MNELVVQISARSVRIVEKRTHSLSINGEDEIGEGYERGVVGQNAVCVDRGAFESHGDIQLFVLAVNLKARIPPCYVYG